MARRRVWRLLIRRERRGEVRKRAALLIQTVYRGYKLRKLLKWWVWGAFTIQVRYGAHAFHVRCETLVE
jgi:hypothetical protein